MDLSSTCRAARTHIGNSHPDTAIEILLQFIEEFRLHEGVQSYYRPIYDHLLLILSRLSRAKTHHNQGLIARDAYDTKLNNLNAAIITLIDQLEDGVVDSSPFKTTADIDKGLSFLIHQEDTIIELEIQTPFKDFSDQDQAMIMNTIQVLLKISDQRDLRVINRVEGSVKLIIILKFEKAKQLQALVNEGTLSHLNITNLTFLQEQTNLIADPKIMEHLGAFIGKKIFYLSNLINVNLSGANLNGVYLRGATLMGAYLMGVDLGGADLFGADLTGADLSGADLRGADLRTADIKDADLTEANLTNANLAGVDLESTKSLKNVKGLPENLLLELKDKKPKLFD